MFFHMVYKSGQIFPPFCHNPRVWRTDGQTDRRTDGQTEFPSLYRVCIACSAVKTESGRKFERMSLMLVVSYVDVIKDRVRCCRSGRNCRGTSWSPPPRTHCGVWVGAVVTLLMRRGVREWLLLFPFPFIPVELFPVLFPCDRHFHLYSHSH